MEGIAARLKRHSRHPPPESLPSVTSPSSSGGILILQSNNKKAPPTKIGEAIFVSAESSYFLILPFLSVGVSVGIRCRSIHPKTSAMCHFNSLPTRNPFGNGSRILLWARVPHNLRMAGTVVSNKSATSGTLMTLLLGVICWKCNLGRPVLSLLTVTPTLPKIFFIPLRMSGVPIHSCNISHCSSFVARFVKSCVVFAMSVYLHLRSTPLTSRLRQLVLFVDEVIPIDNVRRVP